MIHTKSERGREREGESVRDRLRARDGEREGESVRDRLRAREGETEREKGGESERQT